MGLGSNQEIFFRDAFRDARAAAQRDAEGFQEILFALERFGAFLYMKSGKPAEKVRGLNDYREDIRTRVNKSPLAEDLPKDWPQYHLHFEDLFYLVLRGRNDALHQGAVARNLTQHAVELALIIEDALMEGYMTVKSYMVRGVTCAYDWQPVSFARQ